MCHRSNILLFSQRKPRTGPRATEAGDRRRSRRRRRVRVSSGAGRSSSLPLNPPLGRGFPARGPSRGARRLPTRAEGRGAAGGRLSPSSGGPPGPRARPLGPALSSRRPTWRRRGALPTSPVAGGRRGATVAARPRPAPRNVRRSQLYDDLLQARPLADSPRRRAPLHVLHAAEDVALDHVGLRELAKPFCRDVHSGPARSNPAPPIRPTPSSGVSRRDQRTGTTTG